ncbi:hypothetical protein AN639_12035 [Candidatus Epulonipiscium fishelsonii]|uniref:Uncharacterized protein n=1 Tax=Candidatus Epulonipiscium fishelsonii TaxID=77094 RepID=A0ACC8XCJ4_9FIRM|nr:hypothetical protein AN396_06080 [Epulopiscium sp. SCG-B11WGA-EpuloA1]ONI42734.1 hypothetical protein AN639_12035 [Epulopiscium sp. SCG-B05WGA-EpuloA1]
MGYEVRPQKLRIPSGWNISYSSFSNINLQDYIDEPDNREIWLFEGNEDIFQIQKDNILIDLGWYPMYDPEGTYRIEVVKNLDWIKSECTFSDQDKDKIVNKIEEYLFYYSPYQPLELKLEPIPAWVGWEVKYNRFFEFNEANEHMALLYLSDKLLLLENSYHKAKIELGWFPKHSPYGIYRLSIFWAEQEWWFDSLDKEEIIDHLEEIMLSYSYVHNQSSGFCTKRNNELSLSLNNTRTKISGYEQ